jgi:3-deoxy-manno-octulosonate cytidylyltransferase (CMP-KDO synthetase)
MKKKILAIIPARYESSRFEGKPLKEIKGKSMIMWVDDAVVSSNLLMMLV